MHEIISFGNWLRQKRRSLDLTQKAFADQVGCAEITVRRMEADEYKPSKELAYTLFEKLGIPETQRSQWISFARGVGEIPDAHKITSPLRDRKTNLPIPLTRFIGRQKEQEELNKLISKNRLVTVVGMGGIGKTRLALETGYTSLNDFPNGVWLVELASLSDGALLQQVVITTLGMIEQAGRSALDILVDFLYSKRALLILDNCEHLVQACAHLAESLLHSCPDLRILATSRETLGISGESVYLIPPLTTPNPAKITPQALPDYEAVQLFLERAHSAWSDFSLTEENALAIAQVCHQLEGIPLAIELAAARVKVLNVDEISLRLHDRFHMLAGGARTALPRHQTLRAMIDWSYDLLSEKEKLLLRRFAVFSGGWTLELAEQVCTDNQMVSYEILDTLARLVDKSLIVVDRTKTHTRYRILETVRQYAQEKLLEAGEEHTLRSKHRDVLLAFVEKAAPEILGADQKNWIDALEEEHDNIRIALVWSIENQNAEQALRFCSGLSIFWERHKHYLEAAQACKDALACLGEDENLRTTAWHASVLGSVAFYIAATELIHWSNPSVQTLLEQALAIYEALGDYNSPGPVLTSHILVYVHMGSNDLPSAENLLLDLYEKVKASGYPWGLAITKRTMAELAMAKGQREQALTLWQEAYELFMQIGDSWAAKEISRALIWQKVIRGEFEDGFRLLRDDLLFYEEYGDPGGVASSYLNLGTIARETGQYESARRYFTDAITLGMEIGNKGLSIDGTERVAYLDYLEGDLVAARAKYQIVFTQLKDIPDNGAYAVFHTRFAQISLKENQLAEAHAALTMGLKLLQETNQTSDYYAAYYGLGELARLNGNYSEAIKNYCVSLKAIHTSSLYIELPRILDGMARTEYVGSNFDKAVWLFGISHALRKHIGTVIHTVDLFDYDKHLELLKRKMSMEEFESQWTQGAKMSFEEVCQYTLQENKM